MTDKVTPLFRTVTIPGGGREVDPEIVEKIEMLLKLAKAGELASFAFACVRRDRATLSGWVGASGEAGDTLKAITRLFFRYGRADEEGMK